MPGQPIDYEFLRGLFPSKAETKLQLWLATLLNNEFETISDLVALDNDGWTTLGLPLAVTAALKKAIADHTPSVAPVQTRQLPFVDDRQVEQIDCVVMDISGSMRSKSHIDVDKTREDVSKILFHTLMDRLVGEELRYFPHVLYGANSRCRTDPEQPLRWTCRLWQPHPQPWLYA